MESGLETVCRICGLDVGEVRFDEHGLALFVICGCCGTESGVGDDTVAQARLLRDRWLDAQAVWFDPGTRPAEWELQGQLHKIPSRWR
ncbi:hypothetical protein ACFWU3_36275 [Streptomyces sp. NPDC058685]|uniref:hypothetical protein n=1 Tax=Streptomyces sp. NPDC058685 TaxID=3346598 RepID=UPI0036517656